MILAACAPAGGLQPNRSKRLAVVFPVHPRRGSVFSRSSWTGHHTPGSSSSNRSVTWTSLAARSCLRRVTDSADCKRRPFPGCPCVTLRDETEWVETVIWVAIFWLVRMPSGFVLPWIAASPGQSGRTEWSQAASEAFARARHQSNTGFVDPTGKSGTRNPPALIDAESESGSTRMAKQY